MKLLSLDLIAFGPFDDLRLNLDQGGEGLHIVYGRNEAGKSSALRALQYLLFGFPERVGDNFRHPNQKLRVGGALRRRDGRTLNCVRRKGRRNTLRDADDRNAIEESALQAFLGDMDQRYFTSLFGIDHEALTTGGREIIMGGGEVGRILFSAGSGVADIRTVQAALLAEAEDIYKPAGQKPRINAALATFRDIKKKMREAQLSEAEWQRHDQALRNAREEKQAADRRLAEMMRERSRLTRIQEALPLAARRAELLADLAPLEDAVLLPEDFGDRRRDLLTQKEVAENAKSLAEKNLKEIAAALHDLNAPEALIAAGDRIEQLSQDLGTHRKAMKDRTRLITLKRRHEEAAAETLKGLRPDLALEDVEQLRIEKAEAVKIRDIGAQLDKARTRSDGAQESADKLMVRIRSAKAALAELAAPADATVLIRETRRTEQLGPVEENLETARREIAATEKLILKGLKKQKLWQGEPADLDALPLPSAETLDRCEADMQAARQEIAGIEKEAEKTAQALSDAQKQADRLRLEQEVPAEADLIAARDLRDAGWNLVRTAWLEGLMSVEETERFLAAFPGARDLAQAYEAGVGRADDVADRLRREADRVARMAALASEQAALARQAELLKTRRTAAEAADAALQKDWKALWADLGVDPLSPREMRAWTRTMTDLAEQVRRVNDQNAQADALKARIDDRRDTLKRCLADIGAPPEAAASLADLVHSGNSMIDANESLTRKREQLTAHIRQAEEELMDAQVRKDRIGQEIARLEADWADAVKPLGKGPAPSPAQVNALLEDVKTLFADLKEADVLRKRIAGIDRDARAFAEDVAAAVKQAAMDLAEKPAEDAAMALIARLKAGLNEQARQEGLEKQKAQEEKAIRAAETALADIHARLKAMCGQAGCETIDALADAEARSARRKELQQQVEQTEAALRKLGAGESLTAFLDAAAAVDPDETAARLLGLDAEIEALNSRKSELDQTIGAERTELLKMDGSAEAARLAEEAQAVIAAVETDAERYIRRRLASHVLNLAVDRYREKNQGPILKRSGELFSRMTLGSFEGLRLEFGDKGEAVIQGVRPGGTETVGVDGMSDGAADQLYLAVRLAGLEAYIAKNEPMPFIADDILIQFDDARAGAALELMGDLSRKTQVIFFTHHARLPELAAARLDPDVFFTYALER